jgi:aminoglycoside phosphotransferase family enzyme
MMDVEVGLDAKVAFLKRPESYPSRPGRVDAIETHMAWVFLAGNRAYKLKKPVRHSFLDFSTLEARRRDCELEVQLNRRLAPDTYLGTVALTLGAGGALELSGAGSPVEWLVKMRRLPRERMLDVAILARSWKPEDIERVASLLANFYMRAPAEPITEAVHAARLRADLEESRSELLGSDALRPYHGRVVRVAEALSQFLVTHWPRIGRRLAEGRIIEAHGDLRPEHVGLGPPAVIIDCLEFNRAFRVLDAADELAYFALECERLGAPEIGTLAIRHYSLRSGDRPEAQLLAFYTSFRALLRAKIAVWHLEDDHIRDTARWVRRAIEYIVLSERPLDRLT